MPIEVKSFFDEATFTVSHIAFDPATRKCAIIDSVLDYDPASGRTSTASADALIKAVDDNNLSVDWILETHIHADHLTAAPYLKEKLGGRSAIGDKVPLVQKTFGELFNVEASFHPDGRQFDKLLADGEEFSVGEVKAKALHAPGHTPACSIYLIGDAGFVGDTIFMPDYGSARCDFPGGDARVLYRSIQKLFALPGETRLFMCHDYKAPGRDVYAWETTVAEERENNIHLGGGVSEDDFVKMREARDAKLSAPKLLLPSVQVNIRAGQLPPAEDNGVSYLKIPLNAF